MLRRIILFIISFCVLFDPVIGTYTWLQFKKAKVKQEVWKQIDAGIDKSELVKLKFTREEARTELRWEHAREFEYDHKMFDVVKVQKEDDSVIYWCWYDHEETMLNLQMEEIASQAVGHGAKNKKERAMLASNSRSLYCIFSLYLSFDLSELVKESSGLPSDLYSQISIQPPIPPPQFN